MNKANFLAKDSFPVSTYTYDFLQQMSLLAAQLARLGGENYILFGCQETAGVVAPGLVVIAGELLELETGPLRKKIAIRESVQADSFQGTDYPQAYRIRTAYLSNTGDYNWADLQQVPTNVDLAAKIAAIRGNSPGEVSMWAGRVDRLGDAYVLCDGRTLKTVDYPDLAYAFGKENEESFTVPDLKSRFVVGYDPSSSDYSAIGAKGGEEKVTLSVEQMPKHTHTIKFIDEKWGDNANSRPFPNPAGTSGYSANTTETGGSQAHENRPPFYTLAYIIRVKY